LNYLRDEFYKWKMRNLAIGAPENQGFVKLQNSQGGKRPRHKMLLDIQHMGGGRTLLSMLEKGYHLLL
jgi:hypothetical protein